MFYLEESSFVLFTYHTYEGIIILILFECKSQNFVIKGER